MSVEGELSAGLLSTAFGVLTCYGAYLFGRASWRTRSAAKVSPPTVADVRSRRTTVRAAMSVGVVGAAAAIFAPGPGAEKVVGAVVVSLGVVVGLAAQTEPKRIRRASGGKA
jgi:MFS family permease